MVRQGTQTQSPSEILNPSENLKSVKAFRWTVAVALSENRAITSLERAHLTQKSSYG